MTDKMRLQEKLKDMLVSCSNCIYDEKCAYHKEFHGENMCINCKSFLSECDENEDCAIDALRRKHKIKRNIIDEQRSIIYCDKWVHNGIDDE